jgi:hypothetical protein
MNAMDEISRRISAKRRQVLEEHKEAIEDALAGLLAAGVPATDIVLQEFIGLCKTQILVRGVPRYEFQVQFP